MDAGFCLNYFEGALRNHGKHEIFNSDQDSKFISDAFTGVLQQEGVVISMDGRGRAFDNILVGRFWRNVKHEVMLTITPYYPLYAQQSNNVLLYRQHNL